MPLNSVRFDRDDLDESVQCDISNVIIAVREEFSKDIHAEHTET